jgi:predicted RNA-binding protein YlqC (UPF0109 family)
MVKGTTNVTEWLRTTLQLLVDDPDSVRLNEIEGEQARVYEVTVAKSDIGKVIGRSGKTADAVRWILYAIAGKERKKAVLQIVDNFYE